MEKEYMRYPTWDQESNETGFFREKYPQSWPTGYKFTDCLKSICFGQEWKELLSFWYILKNICTSSKLKLTLLPLENFNVFLLHWIVCIF